MSKLKIENFASSAVTVTGEGISETIESGENAVVYAPEGTKLTVLPARTSTFSVRIGKSHAKVHSPYYWIIHPVLCFTLYSTFTVKNSIKRIKIASVTYCDTTSILFNIFLNDNKIPESCGYCKTKERYILYALYFSVLVLLGFGALCFIITCIYSFVAEFSGLSFVLLIIAALLSLLFAMWYKATKQRVHIEKNTALIADDLKPIEILKMKGSYYIKFNELDI